MSTRAQITVPSLPGKASGWRKTVASLNPNAKGGALVEGEWLQAGDVVAVPAGTLVLIVDKTILRWENAYQTGKKYPVEDATLTVHLATPDGLTQLWTRHFKTLSGAFGATTVKKLESLLATYPVPGGPVEVITEACRPNHKAGRCRWCARSVPAGVGHLVGRGEDAQVEHWQDCFPQPATPAATGTACGLCGVAVHYAQARMVMVREMTGDGAGRWEVQHRPDLRCRENVIATPEQQALDARRLEEAKIAFEVRRKQAEAEERKTAKAAEKQRKHDEEQARIAGLETLSRASKTLYDKNLGMGVRTRLEEHVDTLEGGLVTTRWTVTTYSTDSGFAGEDYDPTPEGTETYTRKEIARAAYQALKWTPTPRESYSGGGGTCDNCGGGGARHDRHDSSGIAGRVCNRCDRDEDYLLSFA